MSGGARGAATQGKRPGPRGPSGLLAAIDGASDAISTIAHDTDTYAGALGECREAAELDLAVQALWRAWYAANDAYWHISRARKIKERGDG